MSTVGSINFFLSFKKKSFIDEYRLPLEFEIKSKVALAIRTIAADGFSYSCRQCPFAHTCSTQWRMRYANRFRYSVMIRLDREGVDLYRQEESTSADARAQGSSGAPICRSSSARVTVGMQGPGSSIGYPRAKTVNLLYTPVF